MACGGGEDIEHEKINMEVYEAYSERYLKKQWSRHLKKYFEIDKENWSGWKNFLANTELKNEQATLWEEKENEDDSEGLKNKLSEYIFNDIFNLENCTYSSERGAYIFNGKALIYEEEENAEKIYVENASFKFREGKLFSLTMDRSHYENEAFSWESRAELCFYNFGTTAVILPELDGENGGNSDVDKGALKEDTDFNALVSEKITEAEWKEAFDEKKYNDFSVKVVPKGREGGGYYKNDNGNLMISMEGPNNQIIKTYIFFCR